MPPDPKLPRVLLIFPLIDVPTVLSNAAVMELLEWIDNNTFNLDVDALWGINANRLSYEIMTSLKKYDVVLYYGHGFKNRLMGAFLSVIDRLNIHKVKDSIVYAMACFSAAGLGKHAVEKAGVRAYIGSTVPFYGGFPEKERRYDLDFIDMVNVIPKALIMGASAEAAYQQFQETGHKYLNLYQAHAGYKNTDWYIKSVTSNLKNMVLLKK